MRVTELLDHFNTLNGIWFSEGASATAARSAETRLEVVAGRVEALDARHRLTTAFQPIVDARSGAIRGHEALLRPWRNSLSSAIRSAQRGGAKADWQFVSPEDFLASSDDGLDIVRLDRLCRTLHSLNFSLHQPPVSGDLFLNVHPHHLLSVSGEHGAFFESVLRRCGLAPERVVIEILESSVDDLPRLEVALANYRRRGFRIAIDDFGRRHSNFDRLWQLQPDIVKLDRSLIVAASENPRVRRIVPRLVDIIHELDATTVFEGIETAAQLSLAIDAGADALQGYLLARPAPDCRHERLDLARLRATPALSPRALVATAAGAI
ncbi:EAL domain-containing protein [Rhodocyclus gracilis]|uniref:EAL domain-containing protein n=1 Tax=Rhodocyclus tenuis TaxID=1066 RepID=A0A6L5JUN4_RHOTE|nr:EAL domain-containing protein [Rhodocyclus gracilis]MQY50806.1 EAL domain-containing protein [Rhodocyclus gracilis]